MARPSSKKLTAEQQLRAIRKFVRSYQSKADELAEKYDGKPVGIVYEAYIICTCGILSELARLARPQKGPRR